MANVLLGVTGSVAAVKTPQLFEALRASGHAVRVVATRPSLYFFDPAELGGDPGTLFLDDDEWPGFSQGRRYQRGDPVLHIELRKWADLLLIAPLDANTLAKLACGLADNCLTCVWRAWDLSRPVVLAPAMNTMMWENPLTSRHLLQISSLGGECNQSAGMVPEDVLRLVNTAGGMLRVVPPVSKQLACGDVGVGALAPVEEILAAVQAALRTASS